MPRPRLALALALTACMACQEKPKPSGQKPPLPSPGPSQAAQAPAPLPGPGPKPEAPKLPSDLNVLLITVDAMRADMPWVGYPRPIAPRLTKLAGESVVYTHAYALSSYTSMSLGGLMSGRYPSELPRNGLATSTFLPESEMLAEVLSPAGIRCIGVHGHVYFAGDTGINQGFDDWHLVSKITSRPAREGHIVDDESATLMIDALAAHQKEHPKQRFFAWVHFMDPHFSYAPHEGQERFRGSPHGADAGAKNVVSPGVPLNEIGQNLRNRYDGEIRFTDAQIARLLEALDRSPAGKHTAVIVTADHGEAFGEHHSYFEHGFVLWDVVTRVPLMVRIPGLSAARIDTRRSHIDLARTIFDLFGVKAPASFRGTSLVPELLGDRPPERDLVIDMPYTDQTPRRRALIHGALKLTVTETEEVPTLFDLDADPGEQHDLAPSNEKKLGEMKALWEKTNAALPDFDAPRRAKRSY